MYVLYESYQRSKKIYKYRLKSEEDYINEMAQRSKQKRNTLIDLILKKTVGVKTDLCNFQLTQIKGRDLIKFHYKKIYNK